MSKINFKVSDHNNGIEFNADNYEIQYYSCEEIYFGNDEEIEFCEGLIKIKYETDKILYIIRAKNHYKIGVTKDVQNRLKQIQTGNHEKLELIDTIEIINESLESSIHKNLKEHSTNGEWFDCNLQTIYKSINMFNN